MTVNVAKTRMTGEFAVVENERRERGTKMDSEQENMSRNMEEETFRHNSLHAG